MKQGLIRGLIASFCTIVLGISLAQASVERVTYFHNDAVGSPIAATDQDGNIEWREEYSPYGEKQTLDANNKSRIGFTGHQDEAELGLQYFGARWYDANVGRFTGLDPVSFAESSPVSFNKYTYANNNPYSYVDPDGNWPKLVADLALNLALNYATSGSFNVASALKSSAVDAVNPLATVSKVKKLTKAIQAANKARNKQKIARGVTKNVKDRIQVKDVTNPGSRSPNYQIDKTKSQFEKHLTDNGFDKKTVSTPKGNINIFSKNGQKEFTTRDFSRSTDGPSGEIFTGGSNKASAKIRFLEE